MGSILILPKSDFLLAAERSVLSGEGIAETLTSLERGVASNFVKEGLGTGLGAGLGAGMAMGLLTSGTPTLVITGLGGDLGTLLLGPNLAALVDLTVALVDLATTVAELESAVAFERVWTTSRTGDLCV